MDNRGNLPPLRVPRWDSDLIPPPFPGLTPPGYGAAALSGSKIPLGYASQGYILRTAKP